jgi:hypothetical protein
MAYYHGRKPVKPDRVFFQVRNRLAGSLFGLELIFLVDGERVRAKFRGPSLTAALPFPIFQKLAKGKTVEGQAGYAEFELTKDHLAELKRFAEHFQP